MKANVKIDLGLKQLSRTLNKSAYDIKKNISDTLIPEIKERVPVDTGNLRKWTVEEVVLDSRSKLVFLIGSDEDAAPYAMWVYFGSRGRSGVRYIDEGYKSWERSLDIILKSTENFIHRNA